MHVGKAIQFFQNQQELSGIELAGRINITPQQLSRWRGSEDMTVSSVVRVAEGLGISVDKLIEKALSL